MILSNMPKISVIMPVYNGEEYLGDAINSVLNQTFTDFELIIINDGSTDRTEEIILSYQDKRIKYVKNEDNLKIVATLNKGVEMSRGEYIARMDADDICYPTRFAEQVDVFETKPEVGVCGSWVKTFGAREEIWRMPQTHKEIVPTLMFFSCLMHPSVMMRRSLLSRLSTVYDPEFCFTEDYELWTRLSFITELHNIQKVLLDYRLLINRSDYKQSQRKLAFKIKENYATKIGVYKSQLSRFYSGELTKSECIDYFNTLVLSLGLIKTTNTYYAEKVATEQLFIYCYSNSGRIKFFQVLSYLFKLSSFKIKVLYFFRFIKLWLKLL